MVQHILKGCQRILETVCHFLEEGMTFQEFEEELWETMHSVGREILKVVLETKDQEMDFPRKSGDTVILPQLAQPFKFLFSPIPQC